MSKMSKSTLFLFGALWLVQNTLSAQEPTHALPTTDQSTPTTIPLPLTVGRSYPTPEPITQPTSPEDVLAIVNGTAITRIMRDTYHRKQAEMSDEQALNELITQELLQQAAIAKKLEQIPEAKAELDNQKRLIMAGAAIQSQLNQQPITPDMITQEYQQQLPQLTQTEYKARHIISKTQAEALAIIASLNAGANFEKLAREHSQGSSKDKAGDIDWFNPRQMAKPFSNAIAALTPGTYTKTPVQTRFGWHTILLEATRQVPAPPLKAVQDKITRSLQSKIIDAYLETLKQQSKIEILQK